jgi:hypothetical protein
MKNILFKCLLACLLFSFAKPVSVSGQTPDPVPIAYGQSLTGTLPSTSATRKFILPFAQPGDILFIREAASGVLVKFELFPPSGGTAIKTVIANSFSELIQEIYTIPAGGETGAYQVLISNIGIWTGNFCLSVERMNTPPTAIFLGCDTSQTSGLDCNATVKAFRYLVQAGTGSRITVTPMSISPEVWVCDAAGDILLHGVTTFGKQLVLDTIPAADTSCYYVFVADADGYWDNNFTISHTTIFGACAGVSIEAIPVTGNLCAGESFTLSGASPLPNASYSWILPDSSTAFGPELTISNAQPGQSGFYTLIANTPGFCSSEAGKTITINPLPVVETEVDPATDTVCTGQSFWINATSNASILATYHWAGPGGLSVANHWANIFNPDTSKSGLYVMTVTNIDGCIGKDTLEMTVLPLPEAVIDSPVDGNVCLDETLVLNVATDAPNATFSWTGPNGFTASVQSPTIPNVDYIHAGLYKVTVTNTDTGCSNTATMSVAVKFLPSATISGETILCAGESTTLTAAGGGTYKWSTGETSTKITVSPGSTTTYTVCVTNAAGCTKIASKTITVNQLPSVEIISNLESTEICDGDGFFLLCANTDAAMPTYRWTSPGFLATSQCITRDKVSQSGIYVLRVKDGSTECSDTASLPVFIHPIPEVDILQAPMSPYCAGTDFTLCANSNVSGATYQWTGPNTFTGTTLCVFLNDATALASGIYHVAVKSSEGCTGMASISAVVGTPLQCTWEHTDQSILSSATGSFPPYTYTLMPDGQTNSTGIFDNLVNGAAYAVKVEDANDCSCTTGTITGTTDLLEKLAIHIAPNPSAGVFKLTLPTAVDHKLQIALFDLNGHKLKDFQMETQQEKLDCSDQPPGLYLLRISDGKNVGTVKVVFTE